MQAIREIVKSAGEKIHISVPKSFFKKDLEIIIMQAKTKREIQPSAVKKPRPAVGMVTSSPISCKKDAFSPLSEKELKDWGL